MMVRAPWSSWAGAGLPLLALWAVSLQSGCEGTPGADDDDASTSDDDGSSRPEPPDVDPVTSPTHETTVTLTGHAGPGLGIQVQGGLATVTADSDAGGAFTIPVALVSNAINHLQVRAEDSGIYSDPVAVDVEQDSMPPSPPDVDPIPDQTSALTLAITGSTEAGAIVAVDGAASPAAGPADGSGRFELSFDLYPSTVNYFEVTATDDAGNTSLPTALSIEQVDGPTQPTVYPVESPTNDDPVAITGQADPGVTIRVVGGVGTAEGLAGITGGFSVHVALVHNAINELSVSAVDDLDLESVAVAVTVEHDDIPPDPPVLDAVPDVVGDLVLTVTGVTEPGAWVTARVGAADWDTVADATGVFAVNVTLNADTANTVYVNATDAAGNTSGDSVLDVVHDDSGPSAPTVDAVPSPTNLNPVTLTGHAEPGSTLTIEGGAATAAGPTDGAGAFTVEVVLNANTSNTLRVHATDDAGNIGPQVAVVVVHDDIAPEAPVLDAVTTPTDVPTQVLSGTAEAESTVAVEGGAATASTIAVSGSFSVSVVLALGTNDLLVTAEDAAGNVSDPAVAAIVMDDAAPGLTVNPVVSPTALPSQWVTGTTEPGALVSMAGAAVPAETTADAGGAWSILVELAGNAVNNLSLTAEDDIGNLSAPVVVTIVHDDRSPDPPELDPYESPTNELAVVFTGVTESHATLRITDEGGALIEEIEDVEDGEFATPPLALLLDADNLFVFTVADPAGNVSEPLAANVVQDSIAPLAPVVNPVSSPTSAISQVVTGTTEANAGIDVWRNGTWFGSTDATGAGTFSISIDLVNNSTNTLDFVATDAAGNSSPAATVAIVHDASSPGAPLVDAVASPTNLNPIEVSGRTEAGSTVYVSGGAYLATAGTDIYGIFSTPLYLNANAINYLSVVAVDGAGNTSAATAVTVTHDSLAPGLPVMDPIASYLNDLTATAHGYTEPSALVYADFGGGDAPTQFANGATGEFSWTRSLAAGAIYTWTFRAQDAAGNLGAPAALSFQTCTQRDTWEDTGHGDSCADPIDVGTVDDRAGNTIFVAGNLLPAGDADWYRVYVEDNNASDQAQLWDYLALKVSFSVNDGSAYKFAAYRGSCADANKACAADTLTSYEYTNSTDYCGYYWSDACEDQSGYWYIQVKRVDGLADCRRYELKITAADWL